MNASNRIGEVFERLVALGRNGVARRPFAEPVVYYVVGARCEIDINEFASVYEQGLDQTEIAVMINGLDQIGEKELADEFRRGFELLKQDGFYEHMNWDSVSASVKSEIEQIGARVDDRLWSLDEKLALLLG